jgi:predicted nucleotidyltransferase
MNMEGEGEGGWRYATLNRKGVFPCLREAETDGTLTDSTGECRRIISGKRMQKMRARQPNGLSNSVKVTFLDREGIIEKLRRISSDILKGNKNILGIYLFGSLAGGRSVPGSDADILIVLREDRRRFIDRMTEFLRLYLRIPIAIDVFPYTGDELKTMIASGNRFITTLWLEKVVLAEREPQYGEFTVSSH